MGELEKRYDESRPRVGSSTITDGANDVDPALKELKVKFSRAMNTLDPGNDPRFRKMHFDESQTVLTIPVDLEPDHDYALWLRWSNGQPFTAADGQPMRPVAIRFRTRMAH
jgi:hypothetical protein